MLGYYAYKLYFKQFMQQGNAGKIKIAVIILGLLLLALALTGRAPAVFAILGAFMTQITRFARFLPFLLRYLPGVSSSLGGLGGSGGGHSKAGQSSVVRTSVLVMTLDHDTGSINGEVIDGPFDGRTLKDLSMDEINSLYKYCESKDAEALRLLRSYIERDRSDEFEESENNTEAHASSGDMTRSEACHVLGVSENASKEDIIAAHRNLIGKMHPDKGGTSYIATMINQAKKTLLG